MTNINDIARLAGVSVSTVSRVLNNYKYVAKNKRESVLKVIEEMTPMDELPHSLTIKPAEINKEGYREEIKELELVVPFNKK